jgi:hypothetical protein
MDYLAQLTREIGQNQLPYNPCKLLDFELLVLAPAERISGTTGDLEMVKKSAYID